MSQAINLGDLYYRIINEISATRRSCQETERVIDESRARMSRPIHIPVVFGGASGVGGPGGFGGTTTNNFSTSFAQSFTQNLTQNLTQTLTATLTQTLNQSINNAINNVTNTSNVFSGGNNYGGNIYNFNGGRGGGGGGGSGAGAGGSGGWLAGLGNRIGTYMAGRTIVASSGILFDRASGEMAFNREQAAFFNMPDDAASSVISRRRDVESSALQVPFGIGYLGVSARRFYDTMRGNGQSDIELERGLNKTGIDADAGMREVVRSQAVARVSIAQVTDSLQKQVSLLQGVGGQKRLEDAAEPFNTGINNARSQAALARQQAEDEFKRQMWTPSTKSMDEIRAERDRKLGTIDSNEATVINSLIKRRDAATGEEQGLIDAEIARARLLMGVRKQGFVTSASSMALQQTLRPEDAMRARELEVLQEGREREANAPPEDLAEIRQENIERLALVRRQNDVERAMLEIAQNNLSMATAASAATSKHMTVAAARMQIEAQVKAAQEELALVDTPLNKKKLAKAEQDLSSFDTLLSEEKRVVQARHISYMKEHDALARGDRVMADRTRVEEERYVRLVKEVNRYVDPRSSPDEQARQRAEATERINREQDAQLALIERDKNIYIQRVNASTLGTQYAVRGQYQRNSRDYGGAATTERMGEIVSYYNRAAIDINAEGDPDKKLAMARRAEADLQFMQAQERGRYARGYGESREVFSTIAEGYRSQAGMMNSEKLLQTIVNILQAMMTHANAGKQIPLFMRQGG